MKAIIIEDEPLAAEKLKSLIKSVASDIKMTISSHNLILFP